MADMNFKPSTRMTIAHLLASPFFGGPERQVLGMAEALNTMDFHSTFASFAEAGAARPFLDQVRSRGFEALELRANADRPWRAVNEIRQWLLGTQASVLVTHGYKPNILGTIAARRLPRPVIAVSRGWTAHTWKVRLNELLDRVFLGFADRVVCVSQAQADRVAASGVRRDRIAVIRNAIDPNRFATRDPDARRLVESLFETTPTRVILAAGRLSPEKGFAVLVDAASLLHRSHPDVGVLLVGDGPLRNELADRVRAAGLSGRFVLAGFRSDLDQLLPAVDAIAIPSFTEGLPNVALEACAAGIPVVASNVGGIPEVIEPGVTGWLVSPGDPAELANRLSSVLDDPLGSRAISRAGHERVLRDFSFAAQADAYASMLEELSLGGRADHDGGSTVPRHQRTEVPRP